MKRILFLLLVFLLITSKGWVTDPASWDLLDEDCSDISDWTDGDAINGVSEVSPAGQFHLYNSSAASGSYAQRTRDIGTYPTNGYTFEIKIYHDTLGTYANNDGFRMLIDTATMRVQIILASDGFYIHNGTAYGEVGTNIVDVGAWTVWRFLVDDTDDTIDIYKNTVLISAGVACRTGSYTTGNTSFVQYGYTVATKTHIDYIKAATGLYAPSAAVTVNPQVIFIE